MPQSRGLAGVTACKFTDKDNIGREECTSRYLCIALCQNCVGRPPNMSTSIVWLMRNNAITSFC